MSYLTRLADNECDLIELMCPYITKPVFVQANRRMNQVTSGGWRTFAYLCQGSRSGPALDWGSGATCPGVTVSIGNIARQLGLHRSTVSRYLRVLAAYGLIEIQLKTTANGRPIPSMYGILPLSQWQLSGIAL